MTISRCCYLLCQQIIKSGVCLQLPDLTIWFWPCLIMKYVVPENIHTSPTEVFWLEPSHPFGNSSLALQFLFKNFGIWNSPSEFSITFLGTGMDIFWECTIKVPLYIYFNFLVLRNPHPPGNSSPFCGGSMDIFWNWTI